MRKAAALLIFLVSCSTATNISAPVETVTAAIRDEFTPAWETCKEYVLDRLVAPATAIWPATYETANRLSPNGAIPARFEITGYLDSENSFGALIRSEFRCFIVQRETDWRLEDLLITP